jgi:ATP-dependent Clp endopeptidase proteolytic subunit ClpP
VKNKQNKFFEVKNQTDTTADLFFYGDIVSSEWGAWDATDQYPDKIREHLSECKGKSLNIYVNSGGGSVFAGMAIYSMLKRHDGYKKVYVDGLAGSIASVIALAGDEVFIPSNAYLMIHKPWTYVSGNASDLEEYVEFLNRIEEGIVNVYSEHLRPGVDIETIKDLMDKETWMTGEQAAEYFLVETSDAMQAVACVSDVFYKCKNTPNEFKAQKTEPIEANETEKPKYYLDF